jgi:hypothetical protein
MIINKMFTGKVIVAVEILISYVHLRTTLAKFLLINIILSYK